MWAGPLIARLKFEARYSRARKLFWNAGSRFRDQDFFKRGGPSACGDDAATRPRKLRPHYIGGGTQLVVLRLRRCPHNKVVHRYFSWMSVVDCLPNRSKLPAIHAPARSRPTFISLLTRSQSAFNLLPTLIACITSSASML